MYQLLCVILDFYQEKFLVSSLITDTNIYSHNKRKQKGTTRHIDQKTARLCMLCMKMWKSLVSIQSKLHQNFVFIAAVIFLTTKDLTAVMKTKFWWHLLWIESNDFHIFIHNIHNLAVFWSIRIPIFTFSINVFVSSVVTDDTTKKFPNSQFKITHNSWYII